jgi:hypothetical protein
MSNAPYRAVLLRPRPIPVAAGRRQLDAGHDGRRLRLGQWRGLGYGRLPGRHRGHAVVLYFWFGDAIRESESGSTARASTPPTAGR